MYIKSRMGDSFFLEIYFRQLYVNLLSQGVTLFFFSDTCLT